ncbi:MAG: hypothetical protein H6907_19160 [Hyphomicrobiales bacterium]|nr:hypothetical protein [Hyphomicrobiales bacterium]MCP5373856.1 hypothetical protein [Hyphomicrobiales bacterium]
MRGVLKVVAVNLAVLGVLALVAELVFGNWLFGPEYGAMNLPRNVTEHFDTSGLYAGGGPMTYTRDDHGLRGPYADPGAIDILTIGGSTTNELYVDDALTWQAHMRRLFADAGRPLTIVNAAVDGQSTRGHIAIFERWFPNIPGLRAGHILAYVGINDTAVEDAARWDDMESPDPLRRFRNWIINKSAIYNLFRTLRGVVRAYDAKLVHGRPVYDGRDWVRLLPADRPAPVPPDLAGRLRDYDARLTELVRRIRAFGAKAILVTQPTAAFRLRDGWVWVARGDDGEPETGPYARMDAFNRKTMEVCARLGATCVDLARTVEFADGDFYDRFHNTPQGTAKVGRALFEALKDRI